MPFIGTFLRKMKHLSFERGDSSSRREAVQEMESTLRDGESVFVFPEGTFVPEEGVRPFQLGAFHTAVSTGIPVVPVSLAGTRRFLRDGTILPRPTTVTITLSPPVTPSVAAANSSDWHQVVHLRDTVREQIARFSGEPLI
jgi:fatty-acyl-CoA synthase